MSYMGTHNRLRKIRGSACGFTCPCGGQAQQWAYRHGSASEEVDSLGRRYSRDPDDYVAMCSSCHMRFDKAAITHCPRGHEYAGDNLLVDAGKRKCRTCVYARNRKRQAENGLTPAQRARKSELQRARRQAVA